MYSGKLLLLIGVLVACGIVWGVLPSETTGADDPAGPVLTPTEELFLTTSTADVKQLEILLQGGMDPNTLSEDGITALHTVLLVARMGPIPTLNSYVKTLLQYGANPNLVDEDGWTAMHAAAHIDNETVMEALLDAGGDPLLNTGIPSPYDLALMAGSRATVMAIEKITTHRPDDYEEMVNLGFFSRSLDRLRDARNAEERDEVIRSAVKMLTTDPERAEQLYQRTLRMVESHAHDMDCGSCENEWGDQ